MKRNKKNTNIKGAIFFASALITVVSLIFTLSPAYIYCNDSDINAEKGSFLLELSYSEIDYSQGHSRPAIAENADTIFPILITSIVILGVLIFAMWQTLKNKKHI